MEQSPIAPHYRYIICGAISKAPHDKLLHITNNFVMWCKIACHVKQNCSTWNILLHRHCLRRLRQLSCMDTLSVNCFGQVQLWSFIAAWGNKERDFGKVALFVHSVCANFGLNRRTLRANFGLIARSPVYSIILLKLDNIFAYLVSVLNCTYSLHVKQL